MTEAAADIVPLTAASEPVAIRAAAVGGRAALGGEPTAPALEPFLEDPAPEVRQAALVGLLRHCGGTGKGLGRPRLESLARSPDAARRAAAAAAIEAVGGSDWAERLVELIADDDVAVRRAALSAASRVEGDTVWPSVAAALGDRRVAANAGAALASGGEPAVPCLAAVLDDGLAAPRARILAARALGRIKSAAARRALEARIGAGDAALRTEILESLGLCAHRAEGTERQEVVARVHEEARDTAWKMRARHDLGPAPDAALLSAALDREIAEGTRRLFLLLSFLYDPKAIFGARDNLAHPSKDKRAYASEILDVTLPRR